LGSAIRSAAEQIADQGLRAETDCDADDAGAGQKRRDVESQGRQRAHQRDCPDDQPAYGAQQWLHGAGAALHSALFAAQFDRQTGFE